MNLKIRTATTLLAVLSVMPAFAQTHPTQSKNGYVKTLFNRTDSTLVYDCLMSVAPSEFGSNVPRFAVIGKDHSFYMGIGGNLKATVSFDWGNPIDNPNEFIVSNIPNSRKPGNGGLTQFSAQQSSLFLNFVGLPGSDNQIGVFLGANLLGDDYAPALQYAYIKYRGLTAGYNKTLFSDPAATPPTIDYEGPNASTAIGNMTVNYAIDFGRNKEWKAAAGLELPMASVTDAKEAEIVTQRIPDIPVYIQRSWAGGDGWLRLSAMVRNLQYRNLTAEKNIDKVGWGVMLSGYTPIAGGLSAYYSGLFGKGVTSYIQDLTGCGMDMLPSASDPSVLNTVKSWGAYGGLQYDFSDKVFCTATYSHVRTYASDCVAPTADNQYRYAQYAVANVFWNITPILQAGLEYVYGRRVNYDCTQAHDNRLQTMLQLSF